MKPFKFTVRLSLFISCAVILVACSSGDGVTTSFTVSTSAGANGAISPASSSIILNDTASFTVTPNTGYLIDTVSGCGGTLSGNIYTTAAITADCTVSASFIVRTLAAVSALFPTSAPNWNDYVAGSHWSTATDIASCAAGIDSACLHGGEHRVVEATGLTSCTGMTATDGLGAFNWVCDDSSGTARLISTGMTDGKYLSDLIDFTTPGFKANMVTVFENGTVWGVTPNSVWWTNPVVDSNAGSSFATQSAIYLVTSDLVAAWTLDADKLALVIQPGVTVSGPGSFAIVIDASNRDYLWLEGDINASGDNMGVRLSAVRFSMLRKLASDNAFFGIYLTNTSSNNKLIDVTANNNSFFGITLDSLSNNNMLSGLKANNNSSGVVLDTASNNTLSAVAAINNSVGVSLSDGTNNTLSAVTASNNSSVGISLTDTTNNSTLTGVTASNNVYGVEFNAVSNNTLTSVTVSNNVYGVELNVASNNTLTGVSASNNGIGVNLISDSNSNTLADVAASNNDIGIGILVASNNVFTGLLEVGSNSSDDCLVVGGTNPGLVDTTCVVKGIPDPTLVTGINLANAFVGKVLNDDARNVSDTDGAAIFPTNTAALATFDWSGFDNAFRGWGIDGSDFPDVDHQGQWTTGAQGRIWDWSVSIGDSGNIDNGDSPALLGVLTVPTGNNTLTHSWNGTPASNDDDGCNIMVAGSSWNSTDSVCETTFLRNAVEIRADGLGNDNTLCESGETCLYTPNIGSYQGHGKLVSAGVITAGTLSGITLMKYDSNGR